MLYTYIIPVDDGAGPNPFHGVCTLAICKPVIRRTARVGDWVAGLGSRRAPSGNLEGMLVYAMKVERVLSLAEYDRMAREKWPGKIPNFSHQRYPDYLGDCIYDFTSSTTNPKLRKSVHTAENRKTDLSGKNVLLSKHFYYLGKDAKRLPTQLKHIIHQGQGHRKIEDKAVVRSFEAWVTRELRPGRNGEPDFVINPNTVGTASRCRSNCGRLDNLRNC